MSGAASARKQAERPPAFSEHAGRWPGQFRTLLKPMTIRSKSVLAFYLLAFFCVPLASCDAGLAQTPGAPRASIKLLTIGNSFADNSVFFLPGFAKASGRQLLVFKANLGGRSLQQHAGYLQAFEADPNDPKGRAYKAQDDPRTGGKKDFSPVSYTHLTLPTKA